MELFWNLKGKKTKFRCFTERLKSLSRKLKRENVMQEEEETTTRTFGYFILEKVNNTFVQWKNLLLRGLEIE